MTHAPDPAPQEYSIPDNLGEIRLFPRPIVWAAGLLIVAMAGIGLVQGIHGGMTGGAGNGNQEEPTSTGAVSAQAAQPLSAAPWSTLSGAAMASANAAASARPASASAAASEVESSDASSAAESAQPPSPVSAAPQILPPPAASAQPPQSAQPDTMPPT